MKRRASGFTIVEIAIIIAVIGVISAMALVTFGQTQRSARDDRITADITSLKRSIQTYYNENGAYPTCSVAGICPVSSIASSLRRYMSNVPTVDPTGKNYEYASTSQPNQYGLAVFYQTSTRCKTGANMVASWWSSLPDCSTIYPNRF